VSWVRASARQAIALVEATGSFFKISSTGSIQRTSSM
jgi:hypothetical protein